MKNAGGNREECRWDIEISVKVGNKLLAIRAGTEKTRNQTKEIFLLNNVCFQNNLEGHVDQES